VSYKSLKSVSVLALLAAGAALGGGVVLAQTPGPFTAAQADAGRAAYAANCMSCHQANMAGEGDALPLAGKTFIAAWGNRSAADLYNTIRTSMPYGNPGSLNAAAYGNLVAFILQANGTAPGTSAFTPATPVKISTVASGTVPADIQRGIRQASAAPRGRGPDFGGPAPSADNGAGMIRSFGQTVVGDIKNYVPVTDAMLTNPPEGEWLMGRGNYASWSYSPQKQIDTGNVHDLQLQ
jgi:mono/diheme cytochrome c family protein